MGLMELIASARWREAVTYRETWPHEYVVVNRDGQQELLAAFCERISRGEGVECQFFHQHRTYLFLGDYKYWAMRECTDINLEVSDEVLNRALLYRDRRDFVIRAGDTGIREEREKDEPMTETSEHDTLLGHLAWKLSDRHEDIAVEALGYIFKSSQARRVLEEMLRDRGADVGEIAQVKTQPTGTEGERPDLAGVDRDDRERVLIEAKFWAGLTDNQPVAYLERLPANTPSALLFVAPASRIEPLWDELCQRAGVDDPRSASETAVRSVTTAGARHLMLTSWTYLLERLEGADDEYTTSAVQQLRGLTKMKTEDAFSPFHPLHPDELDPKVPRLLLNLQRFVDAATDRAVAAGCASASGLRVTPKATGYGRYLYLADAGVWFGVDFECWAWGDSYPDTPLWLCFSEWSHGMRRPISETHGALEPLERKDPPECFDEDGDLYVPIELPVRVEYDAVLEAVVTRLQEVSDLISATGDATSKNPKK